METNSGGIDPFRLRFFLTLVSLITCISCELQAATLAATSTSETPSAASPLSPPHLAALATHPEWLALVHYRITSRGKVKESYATSNDFFLAKTGRSDPLAELNATIDAFSQTTPANSKPAACKFPARKIWIEQNSDHQFEHVVCPELDEWVDLDDIKSVSMLFATGHFSSPASYFGHNFLKLNTHSEGGDYLLDRAINVGAVIPPDENPFKYFFGGIFGGYNAKFTDETFSRFLAQYGEKDLRDVWEYELALNDFQQKLIVLHLWELLAVEFPYYFFTHNCASYLGRLLNLFSNETFVPEYVPWTIPITVIDSLMNADLESHPLVSDVTLYRSRRSQFQSRYRSSTQAQKKIVKEYSVDSASLENSNTYQSLNDTDKVAVIDTLLDFSAFMANINDSATHKENQRQLLLHRLRLPQSASTKLDANELQPPHLGQRPFYSSLGVRWGQESELEGILRIRPANYDLLSLDIGRKKHTAFTLLDTTLSFGEDISLESIDIFKLTDLKTQFSGIAIDTALSWEARLSNEPNSDKCSGCNAWLGEWSVGKAKIISGDIAVYGLAGAQLSESRNQSANGGLLFQAGLIGPVNDKWKILAKATYLETFNAHQPFKTSFLLENRFGDSRTWDVRFTVRKRDELNVSLSTAIYW